MHKVIAVFLIGIVVGILGGTALSTMTTTDLEGATSPQGTTEGEEVTVEDEEVTPARPKNPALDVVGECVWLTKNVLDPADKPERDKFFFKCLKEVIHSMEPTCCLKAEELREELQETKNDNGRIGGLCVDYCSEQGDENECYIECS